MLNFFSNKLSPILLVLLPFFLITGPFLSDLSISAISLISILILLNKNKINYLILFILLFLYNPQFTIYNKYYEPLIFIISFLILELNLEKNFFSKKNYITILFFFFISHYIISIGKIFLEIKF